MLYIRQVRVQAPGTMNRHITAVKYSAMTSGPLTAVSRDGANGRKYITTIADGRETNNLLDLPRFI